MVYAIPEEGGRGWQLWLKPRDAAEPTLLPGTENAQNIIYSPDGEWIAFAVGTELRKRPVGDGSTVMLANDLDLAAPTSMIALAWLDDGTILYELPGNTLMRIPENGGQPDTVAAYGEMGFTQLSYAGPLPGSHGALVTLCPEACANSIALAVLDFEADTTRLLQDEVIRGWYTSTGHLLYVRRDGAVFAAPFDLGALELTGPGIPLFEGVMVELTSPQLAVAADGTVLFAEGTVTSGARDVVWVDRTGGFELVDSNMDSGAYLDITLSPNDDRIALTMVESGTPQLWVKELPDGPMTRLTTDEGATRRPAWAPDGLRIAYVTNDGGLSHARSVLADGSSAGAFDVLLQRENPVEEVFFGPEGNRLLFSEFTGERDSDLGFSDLETESETSLLASAFDEQAVSLSPDGRWMVYGSDSSGRYEVVVRPFPSAESRVQVSTNGGTNPVWAHNGREIFFIDGDGWLSVATYQADSTFTVQSRERLFDASPYYETSGIGRRFDVESDDERFLMIRRAGGPAGSSDNEANFVLIQNFFEELRQRMGN
jgi:serine/threonine-protein kinase